MPAPLRFALIGAGRIGRVHASTIAQHPAATLVLVCDPVAEASLAVASAHGARSCTDTADVFGAADVDVVVIGSPTSLHPEHILASVRAGKPALCEKPVAMELAVAEELGSRLADHPDVPVMMGFNRRFDPSFAKARALVADGQVGQLEQLTIISRDPAAPSSDYLAGSGGIFKDMTIHDFDTARFFLGDVTSVTATGQHLDPALAGSGDFDGAVIVLQTATSAVATIVNSRHCATGYDQRLEAFGPKGSILAENHRPTTVRLSTAASSDAQDPYLDFFLERYADAYREELTAFIDAVVAGRPVSPTVADGIAALRIAEAAAQSARTGRTVHL